MHDWDIPPEIQIEVTEEGVIFKDVASPKSESYIKAVSENVWGLKDYEVIFNGTLYKISESVYRLYNEHSNVFEEITFYGKPSDGSN